MTRFSFAVRQYATLDSTNEEAKRLLVQGEILQPTIIRADEQTAGKGTQGRQWFSPPGAGLYFSIVHPFDSNSPDPHQESMLSASFRDEENALSPLGQAPLTPLFTLAAGVACAETLMALTSLTIQLKPINDLYLEGRKLGGILTESLISEQRCRALITGIGINIRDHADVQDSCLIEGRGHQPMSLQTGVGPQIFSQWHPDALLEELSLSIAMAVEYHYRALIDGSTAALLSEYLRYKLPDVALPEQLERVFALS